MLEPKKLKVAIVHDWLVSYRGGEKVLEAICELYPEAPIFTLFYNKNKLPESLTKKTIFYPKKLNSLRFMRKFLLPFLPQAAEELDLEGYDLIISSSSCVVKGVIPSPHAKHICYIHSPMRYIWDQKKFYFSSFAKIPFFNLALSYLLKNLRVWDTNSNHRVDLFLSNSNFVKQRVKRYYGRDSEVLFPSPDTESILNRLEKKTFTKKNYYLIFGALVPYKRFDLAIKAINGTNRTLWVIGEGPEKKRLKKIAQKNIHFLGHLPKSEVLKILSEAKALIFPGTEDFGLTAIEAFTCGTAVIAHKSGGAMDFLLENINGLFFEEKTEKSLKGALETFENTSFSQEKIRKTSEPFSKAYFQESFRSHILKLTKEENRHV